MVLENRSRGIATLIAIGSLIACLVWFGISYSVVFNGLGGVALRSPATMQVYGMSLFLIVLGFLVDHLRSTGNRTYQLNSANRWIFSLGAASQQTLAVLIMLGLYMLASKDQGVSRLFLLWFVVGLLPVLTLIHRLLPQWLSKHLFKGRYRYDAVVVCNGNTGNDRIHNWLARHQWYGVNLQETINLQDLLEENGDGFKTELEALEPELRKRRPAMVIVHHFQLDSASLVKLKQLCDRLGCRMIVALDLDPEFAKMISIHRDGDLQLISIREEPLECPTNRILKRLLDMAIALPVCLFVLPPLTLLVWLVQRKQSPGPIFHRQMRSGLQNERFTLYKYRSMHVGHGTESQQASRSDSRIFPFGRWLRRTSLDEMPQFINVMVGDMSVVGPRPHLPQHDAEFAKVIEDYPLRHFVKPGITGLAQVKGFRGEITHVGQIADRLRSDVFYIEHWSLPLDFEIISKTALQLWRAPETAY
ncbi:putative colanic acid biosynthesis UDP-glucose lipid carrier transferase [Prosthecobacter fusiformis]|uniref:Putative colanic acid biosynthesis UDP-glucose lipid carrier transferase n=1 Tax=Prosthecobacter fusiformis TaxID=48464 RepID=A0A4R7RZI3_9BACT|nr:exopolysaccharide biosynthesis polyprenyl glycosylphosphotransferase [Prosthecobacter fusiformis]TDU71380.1 putative colanic acid biosynthesis UDP-glucose lipid carrier transferase [Prosthecobacter fusiformis]